MIQAEHLQKTFHVRKRNAGFKNAAKAFFSREYEEIHALNDVSFRIEDGEAVGYILARTVPEKAAPSKFSPAF